MKIERISIRNFRRLEDAKIGIEDQETVFVGPNNSGKTSATAIFRSFLGQRSFRVHDFSVSKIAAIDAFGIDGKSELLPSIDLDIWFKVDPKEHLNSLSELWSSGRIKEVLTYCRHHDLLGMSDQLCAQLAREPRQEQYDEALHGEDKGDWLADGFFAMPTGELRAYCDFVLENTAYSTQHGVKGEQYPNVMVVFDDVEAAWNHYSFTKLLTPKTAGQPTEGQHERGRKLAYVCFSRTRENLRILLFTPEPEAARQELIERLRMRSEQIAIG